MRVVTARTITDAMTVHAQWKVGLKLWLDVFDKHVCSHADYDRWWKGQTKSKRSKG